MGERVVALNLGACAVVVAVLLPVGQHFHAVIRTGLVVRLAVCDGGTPQVDVGKYGSYGIATDESRALPAAVGVAVECVCLGRGKVVNAVLEHFRRGGLPYIQLLAAFHVGVPIVGHVSVGAYQIEIAQGAQRKHLRAVGQIVALGVVGVDFHHRFGLAQHDVAVVYHLIQSLPVGKNVVALYVGRLYLQQVFGNCARNGGDCQQLVRPHIAPDYQVVRHIGGKHGAVGSRYHRGNVRLGLPEVLVYGAVVGQKVGVNARHAGRKSQYCRYGLCLVSRHGSVV